MADTISEGNLGRKEVSWRASEFQYVEKTARWFWTLGGATAVFVGIAIWQSDIFFAVFLVLAAVVVVLIGKQRPRVLEFRVGSDSVTLGTNHLKYEELESFSIRIHSGKLDEIILKKKGYFNPFVHIPGDSKSVAAAKEILEEKIPEVEHNESLVDTVSDRFGF